MHRLPLLLLLPGLAAGTLPLSAQGSAKVGTKAEHTFSEPLINGNGVRSLSDLRGRPTILEFWGLRTGICVDESVPAALKFAAQYADDLNLVLVEAQDHSREDILRMALDRKWLGGPAMWTKEWPVTPESGITPNCVLLSSTGEVVLEGNPQTNRKKIEAHIAAFRKSRRQPPDDLPKALRKAHKELSRDKLGAALTEAKRVLVNGEADTAATNAMVARIEARIQNDIARAERAIAEGAYQFGKGRYEELGKLLAGTSWESKVKEGLQKLGDPKLKTEIEAESELLKIEKKLFKSGGSPALGKRLQALGAKFKGTKAAARAKGLAAALEKKESAKAKKTPDQG